MLRFPELDVLAAPSAMPSRDSWTQDRDGKKLPETLSGWPSVGVPVTLSDAPAAKVDRNGSSRAGARSRIGRVASQFRTRLSRGRPIEPGERPLDGVGAADRTDDGSDL